MLRFISCLCMLLMVSSASLHAGDITLHKSSWYGWKFSTDGNRYEKVGLSGKSLRAAMEGNVVAQKQVDRYRDCMTLTVGAAVSSVGLAAYGVYENMIDDDPDRVGSGLWITTAVLVIGGCLLHKVAESHLKKAVRVYNAEKETAIEFGILEPLTPVTRDLVVGIAVRF